MLTVADLILLGTEIALCHIALIWFVGALAQWTIKSFAAQLMTAFAHRVVQVPAIACCRSRRARSTVTTQATVLSSQGTHKSYKMFKDSYHKEWINTARFQSAT